MQSQGCDMCDTKAQLLKTIVLVVVEGGFFLFVILQSEMHDISNFPAKLML